MSDPGAWGIEPGYHDVGGEWHPADPVVVAAVLEAMGARTAAPTPPGPVDVWVVQEGEAVRCDGPWELRLEDGSELEGQGVLPAAIPLGYHDIERRPRDIERRPRDIERRPRDIERGPGPGPGAIRAGGEPGGEPARRVRLIVTPAACHLPEGMRWWGWAAQLASVRSASSWGMGDFGDLRDLGAWAAGAGAGAIQLNPLHAPLPGTPQQPSPYFSSSRCFRSPLYLRIEDVAGAGGARGLEKAARKGTALNDSRHIDRDRVWALKLAVLEEIWSASASRRGAEPAFARFCAEQGELLQGFATFCALTERFGRGWRDWPVGLRRPDSTPVRRFADREADRVRFHAWLQWLVDEQLATACLAIGLVQDLAIGADPAGADAWLWQDSLALPVKVGAPPDEFNPAGQDWGFPPFDPWKLRAAAFEPFIRVLRSVLAHAGGLRIDHVAGLFRLYWIPEGVDPSRGVYVRLPWQEMLGILALESVRAGVWVVGEDLGTVEPYVREEMDRRNILSTKVVWFEPEPPARYPERAVAAVTTHDLPTVAGLWTGSDIEDQRGCGVEPNVQSADEVRQRLGSWLALPDDAPVRNVVVGAYQLLGQAPSALVLATLEDALGVEERPNIPGTSEAERANWSTALPVPLEELYEDSLALNLAGVLNRRG